VPERRIPLAARIVLPAAALAWTLLLIAAPYLGRDRLASREMAMLSAGTYLVGSLICHQRPERSFRLAGARLPVCGRCAGLYLSASAGILLGAAALRGRRKRWPAGTLDWRTWIVAAALPTLATLALEWLGLGTVTNTARAVAAITLGVVVGGLLTVGLSFQGKL